MHRYWLIILLVMVLLPSCSKEHGTDLVFPSGTEPETAVQTTCESPHNLLGYWMIEYDPETNTAEKIPVRFAENHYNVRKMLEGGVCDDCIEIIDIIPQGNGVTRFQIGIWNPFYPDPPIGFDCRGICMFNGSQSYPEAGHTTYSRFLGDGELIDAHGYTALYNGSTAGHGVLGYSKGKWATVSIPDSTLNGFIAHSVGEQLDYRNACWYGTSELYFISFPTNGPFVFGYAVDISWAPPDNPPGGDVEDYPITANAPEPWWLDIKQYSYGEALNPTGGARMIEVEVWDWNGEYYTPTIECSELFDGVREFESYGGIQPDRWRIIINNENGAPPGMYKCLVKVADPANESALPWMDLNAYNITEVEVMPTPQVYLTDITPEYLNIAPWEVDISGDYAYVSGGQYGLHVFDISDPGNLEWISRTPLPDESTFSYENSLVSLDIVENYAFGAVLDGRILVYDISDPYSVTLVSEIMLDNPVRAFDIEVDDEIAYIAGEYNFIAMDIFPPEQAHELCRITGDGTLLRYITLKDDYAYVSEAFHGVHVVDISDPSSMELVTTVQTNQHALGMDIVGNFLYVADGTSGLAIIDITNPETAFLTGAVGHSGGGYSEDVAVYGDTAVVVENEWVLNLSLNGGVNFYDVSNPSAPQYLSTILEDRFCKTVDVSDGYAFAGSNITGLYSVDIDPVSSPSLADSHMAFNQVIDLAYENNKVYAASEFAGLMTVDVTTPSQAYIEHFEQIKSRAYCIDVENGNAYVGTQNFVNIYDVDPPQDTSLLTQHYIYAYCSRILVEDNIVYLVDREFGTYVNRFLIWGLQDIYNPVEHYVDDPVFSVDHYNFFKDDGIFYLGMCTVGDTQFKAYDVDPVESTTKIDDFFIFNDFTIEFGGFVVKDDNFFTSSNYEKFEAFDLETQEIQGIFTLNADPTDIELLGNYAIMACSWDGVRVLDISDPANMTLVDWAGTSGLAKQVELAGNYVYVADYSGGMRIFEIQ